MVDLTIDTTMGTVGTSALMGSLVDLDVLDFKKLLVQTFALGVGSQVGKKIFQNLGTLDGPATLGGTELFSLSATTYTTMEAAERNTALVINDILKIFNSLEEVHSTENSSSLKSVL